MKETVWAERCGEHMEAKGEEGRCGAFRGIMGGGGCYCVSSIFFLSHNVLRGGVGWGGVGWGGVGWGG